MAGSEGGHLTQVTVARTHFSGLSRQEDEWSRGFWEGKFVLIALLYLKVEVRLRCRLLAVQLQEVTT